MKNSSPHLHTKWIIIDGFNLIYKFDSLHSLISVGDLEGAMHGLLSNLYRFVTRTDKVITVVFDGKRKEGDNTQEDSFKSITVLYSISKTADEIIMEQMKRSKTPADYTVVTSDKKIISFVKRRGCRIMTSESFQLYYQNTMAQEKEPPVENTYPEKEKPLSEDEVLYWEKLFDGR